MDQIQAIGKEAPHDLGVSFNDNNLTSTLINDSASAAVNNQESSVPGNGFYQRSREKKKSSNIRPYWKRGPIAAVAGILGLLVELWEYS